ncbi:Ig-like domain-containing protein [Anaeromyxobacter sp. SG64]|uniref:Ig-like domain-containing protein n=1 Tax=Anaeromyxobacter sp. SG64 TaxID=2925409 RepID=UPI001F578344|nr:Ig-like domain-containing protein [Anaeromyxobacter sp. SG64]
MLADRHTARRLAVLTFAAASLAACSGEKSPAAGPHLAGIQVQPASAGVVSVLVGESVRLAAVGTYSDGTTRDVTAEVVWSSAAPEIVAVSNAAADAGLATSASVGTSEVTATEPMSGVTGRVTVEVVPPIVSLAVSPIDPTLLVGTTLQLQADGTLVDDTTADVTATVTWTTSDAAIATVSPGGLVTAVAVGTATITAVEPVSGATASITVEVTTLPAALSYLGLSRGSVIGGGPVQIVGTVALTSPATEDVVVTLTSSNAAVGVPETVTVPAGAQSATFDVTTSAVTRRTKVTLTATDGTSTKTASLNLRVAK